ncbi:hypothetical protein HOLDEFILI_00013 [Holdemania filiformis DSM 12042]|uniref:Uncharacterized protein n=1 Tax=Holdemania filiformis DSM 12042 TaxID=545696 RepID=B9Y2I8_9FIRM|nr:hypothetical protein HOLDEFILI_00013 [Holdemania filiformis DSM 12042]
MKTAVFCQREFSGFNFFWQKLTVTLSKGFENLRITRSDVDQQS